MPDSYNDLESRIQAASASILAHQKPNIAKLAQDYVVPESRFQSAFSTDGITDQIVEGQTTVYLMIKNLLSAV